MPPFEHRGIYLNKNNYLICEINFNLKQISLKHSQLLGTVVAGLIIFLCFMPWSYIAEKNITVSGMNAIGTNFGKPGLLHLILSVIMIVLFNIPKVWAKRTNLFVGAINFSWSMRNFLLVTTCFFGECPQKLPSLFLLIIACLVAMIMTLVPKIDIKKDL